MNKFKDVELFGTLDEDIASFGVTENATLPKIAGVSFYKPRTIIDQTLELIDPTPNIHTLFVQFNERFFWNTLLPVEVKWSNRMTSCAGICSYHPRNKQCVITLSAPLLKLRPRKDLVETLLHEMIHGYLFLTNNNRDRNGHGPEFCKHMHRINNEAGTNITIYHSFHDEVRLYKQHWWRCDGPCQMKAPYFGTVRRSMNRAPGPSDFWWNEHKRSCGGQFLKIKEPEQVNTKNHKTKYEKKFPTQNVKNDGKILGWLMQKHNTPIESTCKTDLTLGTNITSNGVIKKADSPLKGYLPHNNEKVKENIPRKALSQTDQSSLYESSTKGIRKLGNTMNNVHGFAPTSLLDNVTRSKQYTNKAANAQKFSYSGVLGGTSGKSNLIEKYCGNNQSICRSIHTVAINQEKPSNIESVKANFDANNESNSEASCGDNLDLISCPACNIFIHREYINEHLDECSQCDRKLDNTFIESNILSLKSSNTKSRKPQSVEKRKSSLDMLPSKQARIDEVMQLKRVCCPICNEKIEVVDINVHLDDCLFQSNNKSDRAEVLNSKCNKKDDDATHRCLVCNEIITPEISLNDHLEECIGAVFNDSSDLSDENKTKGMNPIKHPCPVCMELHVPEHMNEHLDNCLIGQ